MKPIVRAGRMKPVHSDIRGPLFVEAMKRQKQGIDILKLNTGSSTRSPLRSASMSLLNCSTSIASRHS